MTKNNQNTKTKTLKNKSRDKDSILENHNCVFWQLYGLAVYQPRTAPYPHEVWNLAFIRDN